VVARVNGVPVSEAAVADRLWREFGPTFVDVAVKQTVVRAEAKARGITVTPEELEQRMTDYHAAFTSAPGHQPQDWDDFVARFTLKRIEEQQRDDLLARKIGEAESKAASLTDEEKARALADLDRDAHQVRISAVFVGAGVEYGGRSDSDAHARAEGARSKLAGGAAWNDAAAEYSDDVSTRKRGGDMGFLTRGQMLPELEAAAFETTAGSSTVRLVKVDGGYCVFQVAERKDTPPTEADKAAALEKTLQRKRGIVAQVDSWYPDAERRMVIQKRLPYETSGPPLRKGVVANIGNQAILASAIQERLWREDGQSETDREINKLITRLEAKKRGISVTPAEVAKERQAAHRDFITYPGVTEANWNAMLARAGENNWDDDAAVRVLARKIGDAEAAKLTLTAAETAKARAEVKRRAHRIHARHIWIGIGDNFGGRSSADGERMANDVLAKLNAGGTWDDLAKQFSADYSTKSSGGDLGEFSPSNDDRIPTEVDDVALSAAPGSPAQVVKAADGYHVFQVLSRAEMPIADSDYKQALDRALAAKQAGARAISAWFPKVMLRYKVECTMPYSRG
jgi:foldase protein PrsA